ncbi:MAG: lactate utilization protein [Bacillota bacterium]|nr:lactate utilization protein [Bacillota bacterium]MDI3317999.1 lactate utilization protein [Bacillota bacterium]
MAAEPGWCTVTGEERVEAFRRRWEALGGRAVLAEEGREGVRAAVRRAVESLLAESAAAGGPASPGPAPVSADGPDGTPLAVLWDDPELAALDLAELLERLGLRAAVWRAQGSEEAAEAAARLRGQAARAVLGVTGASWAVAETGTVALSSDRGSGRLVSLLPPAHLAVVRRSRVVETVGEGFRLLMEEAGRRGGLPSAVHLISGPSMSADIEGELTVGVHGPGRVVAVIGEW